MNSELKQRWVEALRSGKYRQGVGSLRNVTGYCCLGVLCDLVDPEGWQRGDCFTHWLHRGFDAIPDPEIITVTAMRVRPPGVDIRAEKYGTTAAELGLQLSHLNDGGWSFEELADLIEAQL